MVRITWPLVEESSAALRFPSMVFVLESWNQARGYRTLERE